MRVQGQGAAGESNQGGGSLWRRDPQHGPLAQQAGELKVAG